MDQGNFICSNPCLVRHNINVGSSSRFCTQGPGPEQWQAYASHIHSTITFITSLVKHIPDRCIDAGCAESACGTPNEPQVTKWCCAEPHEPGIYLPHSRIACQRSCSPSHHTVPRTSDTGWKIGSAHLIIYSNTHMSCPRRPKTSIHSPRPRPSRSRECTYDFLGADFHDSCRSPHSSC